MDVFSFKISKEPVKIFLLKSKEFSGAIKVKLLEKKVSDTRLTQGVPPKTSPNRNPFNSQGGGSQLIRKVMMIMSCNCFDFYQLRSCNKKKIIFLEISRNYELCEDSWQLVKNASSTSA